MNKYRVLNTMLLDDCPDALDVFDGIADVDTIDADYESVLAAIGNYDAYLPSLTVPIDEKMVANAVRLKVIGTPSTGTDHLDLAAIRQAGIACFDISRELDLIRGFTATSELAFTLLLNVNRKTIPATASVLEGQWGREEYTGFQLRGKTFGILGLGRLGTISAHIANGFGMRVIAHDVAEVTAPGVEMVDFETLYREADVLTIHVHLRDDTRGMISREVLAAMKPTSILINTSRGAIVDEAALLEALKANRLGGAGLDMIDGEWLDDVTRHPLVQYAAENTDLVITPHIGGATHESIYGARVFMARKVADYLGSLGE